MLVVSFGSTQSAAGKKLDGGSDVVPKVEELGLKVLFLLIPGIIALGVMKALGPRKPRSDFEQGLQIFVYGVVCYALTGFVEGLSNLTGFHLANGECMENVCVTCFQPRNVKSGWTRRATGRGGNHYRPVSRMHSGGSSNT
jgi:hypothetical protein